MTIDEYAALQLRLGNRVVRAGGVWWRCTGPCFYRPLFPFDPLPTDVEAPPLGRVGGWQHAVPEGSPHNSHLNYVVFTDLQSYDASRLKREDRKNLRRAARHLTFRRITDLEEFCAEGLPLLCAFFGRSDYRFRRDRQRPAVFRRWASVLLAEPRVLVLGSYSVNGLCEVHVSLRVQDALMFEVAFANREARLLRSSDGVLDYLRRHAAQTDARLIDIGSVGVKPSLDGFKLRRGARVLTLPALLRVNPLADALLRLSRATWRRVHGMNEAQAVAYTVACPRA